MPASFLQQFAQSPLGRPLLKVAQPAIHFARRRAHPDVPLDQQLSEVPCAGQTLTIRHRRWDLHDALCLQQCFGDRQYDMPVGVHGEAVRRFYDATVAAGRKPLILDCGANIGASVMWFGTLYPEAHIVAVEPAPDNCDMLRHNSAQYSVDIVPAAVGSTDGQAFLTDEFGTGMGYRITDKPTPMPMKVFSIRTLLASYDPAVYTPFLLKIDIEGGEKTLFNGDTSALDAFPVIIVEPHDWMFPGEQMSLAFFRFHVAAGREFSMKHENVASLAWNRLTQTQAEAS